MTKHFSDEDRNALNTLRQHVGRAYYDINIYRVNCDLADGKPERSYANALLVGLTEPDGDASSGAPATFALTFSINGKPGHHPS